MNISIPLLAMSIKRRNIWTRITFTKGAMRCLGIYTLYCSRRPWVDRSSSGLRFCFSFWDFRCLHGIRVSSVQLNFPLFCFWPFFRCLLLFFLSQQCSTRHNDCGEKDRDSVHFVVALGHRIRRLMPLLGKEFVPYLSSVRGVVSRAIEAM